MAVRVETDGVRWVALRIAPSLPTACAEFSATDELLAEGFRAYCPRGTKWVFWDRGRRSKTKIARTYPIFSRYIFLGLSTAQFARKNMVRHVEAVLGDSAGPVHIPPAAIRLINDLELAGEWDQTKSWREKAPWKSGDLVQIGAGAFAGFHGTVDQIASENRIRVLVDMFGRRTSISVEACQISAA